MKKLKNMLAVLLCLVMLFAFTACRDNDENTDATAESTTTSAAVKETEKTLEEVGLSIKRLTAANQLETLMEKHDTLTVSCESSDGSSYIRQVFRYDGELAYAQKENGAVSGFIKGFDFAVENGRVKAYRDIEDLERGEELDMDDLVTDLFEDKKLVCVSEEGDVYKLKSLSEDESKKAQRYFYFDKESLALTAVSFENSVGNKEDVTVAYDGELEDFAKEIADAFDGEMKTVKIVAEIVGDGAVENVNVSLSLPACWEYVPSGDGRIDYYMNDAMTEAYAYPGDGEDYTLYISNIFDEDDSGKK